jgi:hypothetical protein
VAQVGVQRLGAGHAQHHRAQRDEGDMPGCCVMKRSAWCGRQRHQHLRVLAMCTTPSTASTTNHSTVTGPKKLADAAGAEALGGEQRVSTTSVSGTM